MTLIAAQLFPHQLLVPGWSPRHLLKSATRTVPEREKKGGWYTPFYADHSRLASPERRAHHFLPRTGQYPPSPLARAAAGRTTEALPRSYSPDVDVAGRAGETRSGPGTTAAFYSPKYLFLLATHLDHWEASSKLGCSPRRHEIQARRRPRGSILVVSLVPRPLPGKRKEGLVF